MNEIKYYSFDLFDTLITRLLNKPTDLFSIIEKEYNLANFKENRINAEYNAVNNSNHEEITIDEIYKELEIIDPSIDIIKVKKIYHMISYIYPLKLRKQNVLAPYITMF